LADAFYFRLVLLLHLASALGSLHSNVWCIFPDRQGKPSVVKPLLVILPQVIFTIAIPPRTGRERLSKSCRVTRRLVLP